MNSALQDIFLDFLNRDSREIYGLYAHCTSNEHVRLVVEGLNVAAILCRQHCIAPPGFLAECEVGRKAVGSRRDLLIQRLILLPMRESTLDELFEKKREEYGPFQKRYSGLFAKRPPKILCDGFQSIIRRETEIGNTLVKDWQRGLDADPIWKKLAQGIDSRDLEVIRIIPDQLRKEGLAVTWAAIESRVLNHLAIDPTRFRIAVQYHYFRLYIREFNLTTITRLPFAPDNFGLGRSDFSYDYEMLKGFGDVLGIWSPLISLSAASLLRLRNRPEFFRFRGGFHVLGTKAESLYFAKHAFAVAAERFQRTEFPEFAASLRRSAMTAPDEGIDLNDNEIAGLAMYMENASSLSLQVSEELRTERDREGKKPERTTLMTEMQRNASSWKVAVFVALREERQRLINRWNLKNTAPSRYWTGRVGYVELTLYSPNEMGRVPAALETGKLISTIKPDLIIVTGIAAGFPEEKVELGDVLLPRAIIDLASRKMREVETQLTSEFRPREFRTDKRVIDFVDSGEFVLLDWQNDVVRNGDDWPTSRRPALRYECVASLDDVVASDEWRKKLHDSWPKLEGIEMEAGGVFAAAEREDVPVSVIRGVSDLADPVKSDTTWRKLGLLAAAILIEKFATSSFSESSRPAK